MLPKWKEKASPCLSLEHFSSCQDQGVQKSCWLCRLQNPIPTGPPTIWRVQWGGLQDWMANIEESLHWKLTTLKGEIFHCRTTHILLKKLWLGKNCFRRLSKNQTIYTFSQVKNISRNFVVPSKVKFNPPNSGIRVSSVIEESVSNKMGSANLAR